MKILIYCLLTLTTPLLAAPSIYEGFDMGTSPAALGSESARSGVSSQGWLSDWHLKDGNSRFLPEDLTLAGLESANGLVSSKGKTVAMRQLAETLSGDVYGSFRVRGAQLKTNSMMGLMISLPDVEPMNPKTSFLSFMATRWGSELGGLVIGGKPVKVDQGAAIPEKETALVLWKIDNLPEPGKKSDQVIQMWVLNAAQVAHFAADGMKEKVLTKARQGSKPDEVLQYVRADTRGSRLTLVKGLVISCFSADVPKAEFDEIRLSRESLADAAGVGGPSPVVAASVPNADSVAPATAAPPVSPLAGTPERRAARPGSPDILFVLLDDLRWDGLGYMNHPYVTTPNIDSLRDRGAMMQNAFVTTSICCPSRATFLTGTLANQHGVIDNETSEYNPDVTPPLTKYLQEAGYQTAMIGKWHMGNTGAPRPYFDFWLSFKGQGVYNDPLFNINGKKVQQEGYTTDLLTDYAIDFIEKQPKDQPYFCMLSHKAVHEPFQPAPRHKDAFGANTTISEPASWSEDFADKPDWHKRQRSRDVRWNYRTRDYEEEQLPEAIPVEPWEKNKKYVDQFRCLSAVDEGLGRIIEVLRKRGTLDNTVIVFTSDNGYFHLEHRRWDKRLAYEESLRIPMVVVYPGHIEAGSTVSQLVTNADFAPTILSYAGLPVPSQMQGSSMKPLFEEAEPDWRDSVFYEYWKDLVHAIPAMTAIRTERYKLITYPEINDIDELFDLQADPHEMDNLAIDPAYAGLHASMTERLEKARAENQWRLDVFPKNLPRVRGQAGVLLDLAVEDGQFTDKANSGLAVRQRKLEVREDSLHFDGDKSAIQVPFNPLIDPSGWPFHIDVSVMPESDGVIAVQSTPGYGFKIFVQDGRPGVAVHCKTWIDTTTTIDGPESILGKWAQLKVVIDYNRLTLLVDGVVAESISLPQPFKGSPETPLVIGSKGTYPVVDGVPDQPFAGSIRRFTLQRGQFN